MTEHFDGIEEYALSGCGTQEPLTIAPALPNEAPALGRSLSSNNTS
ncbi:hypothetical protein [uncultured Paraglaciecola sp.]|nr:hypothetical protein [uncultured Paraglaciecola sp.]